jgi:sarcosine oxidase subunit gamma
LATPQIAIIDQSERPRLGFKGRGTLAAMQKRGVVVEDQPNRAFRQADGGLCLVLAASEVFLLGSRDGEDSELAKLDADWRLEDGERTYPMPRRHSHTWFAVQGQSAPDMLAKLCAIDLRPHRLDDLSIAQTSLAGLNAIVLRADVGDLLTYHVLADSASAVYLLACLKDAAEEFGGGVTDANILTP